MARQQDGGEFSCQNWLCFLFTFWCTQLLQRKTKKTDRVSGGGWVVPVELDQVVEGEEDAHQVDKDPQEVQDVVPDGKGGGKAWENECEAWGREVDAVLETKENLDKNKFMLGMREVWPG